MQKNPLLLPEITTRVASYVSTLPSSSPETQWRPTEILQLSLVCTTWYQAFYPRLWIYFDDSLMHNMFPSEVLESNGHHVRILRHYQRQHFPFGTSSCDRLMELELKPGAKALLKLLKANLGHLRRFQWTGLGIIPGGTPDALGIPKAVRDVFLHGEGQAGGRGGGVGESGAIQLEVVEISKCKMEFQDLMPVLSRMPRLKSLSFEDMEGFWAEMIWEVLASTQGYELANLDWVQPLPSLTEISFAWTVTEAPVLVDILRWCPNLERVKLKVENYAIKPHSLARSLTKMLRLHCLKLKAVESAGVLTSRKYTQLALTEARAAETSATTLVEWSDEFFARLLLFDQEEDAFKARVHEYYDAKELPASTPSLQGQEQGHLQELDSLSSLSLSTSHVPSPWTMTTNLKEFHACLSSFGELTTMALCGGMNLTSIRLQFRTQDSTVRGSRNCSRAGQILATCSELEEFYFERQYFESKTSADGLLERPWACRGLKAFVCSGVELMEEEKSIPYSGGTSAIADTGKMSEGMADREGSGAIRELAGHLCLHNDTVSISKLESRTWTVMKADGRVDIEYRVHHFKPLFVAQLDQLQALKLLRVDGARYYSSR